MDTKQHEIFILRVDINRSRLKRFYQLLRAADFYGQIKWEFRLGLSAPEMEWQGFKLEQDFMLQTLQEHLPALQTKTGSLTLLPLLRYLARPSASRWKENLSFSPRQG